MRCFIAFLAILIPASAQNTARQSNMELVGFNDLQARSAYQPVIQKQGDRWIAYIGHHAGVQPNSLTGKPEQNGTSIVDVTDPKRPQYLAHIPGETVEAGSGGGGAQMVRVCAGSDLPKADKNKFYMLRSFGASAHEMWDVTAPAKPVRMNVIVGGLRDTHKSWWECDTGIAYLVGGVPGWRTPRMAMIYDLSDPAKPVFIRYFGLPGQQPGARGPTPESLHGPVSTGPKGNRVYFAYGNDRDGVLEIVDRDKLLNGPKDPTDENLRYPVVSRLDFPEDVGAHNAFPLLHMQLPEFAKQKKGGVKDFVAVIGETVANECQEFRQTMRMVDVSDELKPTAVSTWTVPESSGNFCSAGGRFGAHSSNENFTPIYYNRVLFLTYFNAGVRAVDIRDPFNPKEIGYYIPAISDKTDKRCVGQGAEQKCKAAIQTNNVEVDDRGYIYIVDRANTGMHILALGGPASQAAASVRQLMLDLIYPSSNDLLLAVNRGGLQEEKDWAAVRRSALSLTESAYTLARDHSDWTQDAKRLADAGNAAYQAAQAKDAKALAAAARAIDDSCTVCHKQYRPNVFPKGSGSK